MTNEELWKAVLGEMELSLSRANFTTWFKNTFVVSKDKNSVLVSAPNGFIKEWLENKFNKKILQSVRNLHPEVREVKYIVGKPKIELIKQDMSKLIGDRDLDEKPSPEVDIEVDKNTNLNRKYSFDSFVVGLNNELAQAACLSVSKNLGKIYNPLFLYGGVGLGKTHLLQSLGNKIVSENKDKKVLYVPAERFTSEIIEAIRNRSIEELKAKYAGLDLLILDDIQFIAGKERTQDVVFSTFNELYGKNKQIVLSSDRPPKAIPALEDEVLSYIATHIQKNVRELEGALNRVVAFSQIYNRTPELKEVKNILNTYLSAPYRKTPPPAVLKAVADFYNISLNDLFKRSRKKEVVRPRQIAMYLLREETKLSFPEIGQRLGGRDHSTVIHACEKIREESSVDEPLRQELVLIKERVYNSFDK